MSAKSVKFFGIGECRTAFLTVLASALPLLGYVSTAEAQDQSIIGCSPDEPTANLRGDRWAPEPNGSSAAEVSYYIRGSVGNLSLSSVANSVVDGFNDWVSADCGTGTTPNIPQFTRTLTAPAQDNIVCSGTAVDFDNSVFQRKNEIVDVPSDWATYEVFNPCEHPDITISNSTIAFTFSSSVLGTGRILESDIYYNSENYDWRDGSGGCSTGSGNCYDFFTVTLHEQGHFIGLNHVDGCGAVMESSGPETLEVDGLTANEVVGVCSLYPPRDSTPTCDAGSNCRAFGELCTSDDQCSTGSCLQSVFGEAGWCSVACDTNTDCEQDGFLCRSTEVIADGTSFGEDEQGDHCRPDSAGLLADCECDTSVGCDSGCSCDPSCGATDSNTPAPADDLAEFCEPCLTSDDCEEGLCVIDPTSNGYGLCPARCTPGAGGCPAGFSCVSNGICWPDDPVICEEVQSGRGGLDDLCFVDSTEGTFYNPCAPGLVCFGFRPQCAGQVGECVQACDGDSPCSNGMTCCSNIDEDGHCSPAVGDEPGGCFDIRTRGQTCTQAENSICDTGDGCYALPGKDARCYQECGGSVACAAGSSCYSFTESDANGAACREIEICCRDNEDGILDCDPMPEIPLYGLGTSCESNDQCDSGNCAQNPEAPGFGTVCSRECNVATGIGCPSEDSDVNGDGKSDGGFSCVPLADEGRCFPTKGRLDPYIPDTSIWTPPTGGCCGSHGLSLPEVLLHAWPFIGLWWARRRRRSIVRVA